MKKSKSIKGFESILDFIMLFILSRTSLHLSLSTFHLDTCHSVDTTRLYDRKIIKATGLPSLKAQTMIPYPGEVKMSFDLKIVPHYRIMES